MEQKRILVVDDEVKIIEVVKSYLEAKGFLISSAENGKEALSLFRQEEISLILLDLMLPDISGEDICMEIRKTSTVPIIMITAKIEEEDMLKGLNIGADDYITKPFSLKALYARINAVLRRCSDESNSLYNEVSYCGGDLQINFDTLEVRKKGELANLTPNEFKLLETLAKNPNKVFSREDLIDSTFGYDYEGYSRTIDSYIRNIRGKIEDDSSSPVYIKTIHGIGYRFGGG